MSKFKLAHKINYIINPKITLTATMTKKPLQFTSKDIDTLILLRFGRLITSPQKYAILTLAEVAKLVKISVSSVKQLINERFRQLG